MNNKLNEHTYEDLKYLFTLDKVLAFNYNSNSSAISEGISCV